MSTLRNSLYHESVFSELKSPPSALNVKLGVKFIITDVLHSDFWEGSCRVGKPRDLSHEADKSRLKKRLGNLKQELNSRETPPEIELIQPGSMHSQAEKGNPKLFKAEIGLRHNKNSYSLQKYHQLGNKINKWLKETYKTYGINISVFASKYISDFYDKTHEYDYDNEKGKVYLVKAYDYKNSDNLFAIDEVYEKIKKKPFIENRKLELEILFMHFWLSEIFGEESFWEVYLSKYPEKEEIVKG